MTVQASEQLILDCKTFSISYVHSPSVRKNHPQIRYDNAMSSRHSGCWRGYHGTWEIKDQKLYLKEISGIFALIGTEPVFADWFTGSVLVPQGEVIDEVCDLHESDLHIHIEKGIKLGSEVIDNQDQLEEILERRRNVIKLDIPPFLRRQAD